MFLPCLLTAIQKIGKGSLSHQFTLEHVGSCDSISKAYICHRALSGKAKRQPQGFTSLWLQGSQVIHWFTERESCSVTVSAHTDEEPQHPLYFCTIQNSWKAHWGVKLKEEWAQLLAIIFSLLYGATNPEQSSVEFTGEHQQPFFLHFSFY